MSDSKGDQPAPYFKGIFSRFFNFLTSFNLPFKRESLAKSRLSQIHSNISNFFELSASDIMSDRSLISFIDEGFRIKDLKAKIQSSGLVDNLNILVCKDDDLDNIIGFIRLNDLREYLISNSNDEDIIVNLCDLKTVVFVAPSMKVLSLLSQLKKSENNSGFVVVIDEYRGTDGIITLNSLSQSICEHLSEERSSAYIDKIEVGGFFSLRSLEKKLKVTIREDEDVPSDIKTVGGFLSFLFDRIPNVGDSARKCGLLFEVKEADAKHVKKVAISKVLNENKDNS